MYCTYYQQYYIHTILYCINILYLYYIYTMYIYTISISILYYIYTLCYIYTRLDYRKYTVFSIYQDWMMGTLTDPLYLMGKTVKKHGFQQKNISRKPIHVAEFHNCCYFNHAKPPFFHGETHGTPTILAVPEASPRFHGVPAETRLRGRRGGRATHLQKRDHSSGVKRPNIAG